MANFKDRLEELRIKHKIKNPAALSRILGLSDDAVRNYLNGRNLPDSPTLLRIAEHFADENMDVGAMMIWLLTGQKSPNSIPVSVPAPARSYNNVAKFDDLAARRVADKSSSDSISHTVRSEVGELLGELDKFDNPAKVRLAIRIVKILNMLPDEKVGTTLKMVETFKEESEMVKRKKYID